MNLVLIGYRGTGKSHIGRVVGKRLGMRCYSLDREVEKQAGSTISDLVAAKGWPAFRDLESEMVTRMAAMDQVILDTGGGVIERVENVETLRKNACVVWLKAGLDTIVNRISSGVHRPSLTADKSFTEEVSEVLERRNPLYRSAADYEVDTDGRRPDDIADQIIEFWNRHRSGK